MWSWTTATASSLQLPSRSVLLSSTCHNPIMAVCSVLPLTPIKMVRRPTMILHYPEAPVVEGRRRYQVLSLSGGGYRGLFTASLLAKLEAEQAIERPLRERFDLIIGTSIGGIIAAGLAVGIPARQIRDVLRTCGPSIFDRRVAIFSRKLPLVLPDFWGLFWSRYESGGLHKAVSEALGAASDLKMHDVNTPLLLVAVDRTLARPHIFTSGGVPRPVRDEARLVEAALATSAAPTYFPEQRIGSSGIIDGGLIANAPDLLGLVEAMACYRAGSECISVLGIGTASTRPLDAPRPAKGRGMIGWGVGRKLVSVAMAAQEGLGIDTCQKLLGERHIRLDIEPNAVEAAQLGLDRADKRATEVLDALSERAWHKALETRSLTIRSMLQHNALWAEKDSSATTP
jgi:hypothetical protein